ncbi:hypothetical protein APU01nite_08050 [Alkalibacterium putridalgicola]|uniref:Uncharacterized protein n=1 Tax=Alkalibacterium putridalgicola TaxID=426703 RepID=A0ABQ0UW67_9LACT|nr:hypothetical protein APU01nite_08050 [Alkalibacterium putridalgicola]
MIVDYNTLSNEANTGTTIVRTRIPITMRVIVPVDPFSFLLAIGCAPTFLIHFSYKCTESSFKMQESS